MDKSTHEIRLSQWKMIIEQCQKRPEGLTTKQWLIENGISDKTYYYWLRKVRREAYSQLNGKNNVLPAVQENTGITFTELPWNHKQEEDLAFSFEPAAVIKTAKATVALSNTISDKLLAAILQEVSHA